MGLSNYHVHTTFCDGKNTAEEMIIAAINSGCDELGISAHAPMDFECNWCMKKERLDDYLNTLKYLKEKYKNQIKIYIGLEQDYYSNIDNSKFDYIIGSVHFIYKNGDYLQVDKSYDTMLYNIKTYYNDDVYAYCEDYYKVVADIYNKTKCNIVGHFDLITKFNEKHPIIDTNHPRYVNAVLNSLNSIMPTNAIFEINTGPISRNYRSYSYPEDYIVDTIGKSKPFVVNSDCHRQQFIVSDIKSEREKLTKNGHKYISSLSEII